jgi:putative ABC transport system permease protein
MTELYFAVRTFLFFLRQNLTVALGVAISTAVLVGGLIIGDSVTQSLERGTSLRLGKIQIAVSGNERIFTSLFGVKLQDQLDMDCAPLLQLGGSALADGGRLRINKVQVNGVNGMFDSMAGTQSLYTAMDGNEVLISENLAARLELKEGDFFVLQVQKASVFPMNTPFVSSENTTVSMRVKVKSIAGEEELGRFNLRISQTAPFNVFVNLDHLNGVMDLDGRANIVLIGGEDTPSEELVQDAIRKSWELKDAGLQVRTLPDLGLIELKSERVFIEPAIDKVFEETGTSRQSIITYFVNDFRYQGRETPYSFISTIEGMNDDHILINDWLAGDLGVNVGDSLEVDYFVPGPLRKLEEHSLKFVVEDILSMEGVYADENLVPDLPGLSDAGHCRDWEAGIPIDLERIREKDEDYWNRYRGTPKAFISLNKAEEIWENRFGNYTALRFSSKETNEDYISQLIKEELDPSDLGISVLPVRESGFEAARGGIDFSQLFLSLSFLVLASSIILTLLLFRLNLQVRISQAGTLRGMGYSKKHIRRIYLIEGAFSAMAGGIPGIFLAILFTRGVFHMLETIWSDIVRTSILQISIQPMTLLIGYCISVFLSWLGIYLLLNRQLRKSPVLIQSSPWKSASGEASIVYRMLSFGSLAAGLLVMATGAFMISGGLILVSLILLQDLYFIRRTRAMQKINIAGMVLKNAGRNRQRRFAIIILFAIGTYTVVLTGSNRRNSEGGQGDNTDGTGGFEYFAESSIPILYDLNDNRARMEAGIEGSYSFIQFRRNEGDDASCLNLNRVVSPVLLGVDPSGLEGRFRFVSGTSDLDNEKPWKSLERVLPGGVVPAIADQTVIQWGLGKKVGDTLFYRNERGDSLKIKLVGGIAPSVLQGNVLISDENFLNNYPSSSGASVYLVEPSPENESEAMLDLSRGLRENGWFMTGSHERLAEFDSVQNTYLSIFALLGVLAILLGTVGLGIVLVRDVMERKREMGVMQSIGYGSGLIFKILFGEYFLLISAGLLSGFFAGVVSTLPELVSVGYMKAFSSISIIMIVLLINSILWISVFVWGNIRKDYKRLLSED